MSETLERHRLVRSVFEQVRELPPADQRAAIADACEPDASLAAEVAGLLIADARVKYRP